MASTQYLDFIGSVWNLLADDDKQRFGEVWQGIEQITAAAYQKFIENNLNITTSDLQAK